MLNRILAPVAVAAALLAAPHIAEAGDLAQAYATVAPTLDADQTPRWTELRDRLDANVVAVPASAIDIQVQPAPRRACKTPRPKKDAVLKAGHGRSVKGRSKQKAAECSPPQKASPAQVMGSPWMAAFEDARTLDGRDRVFAVDAVVNALPYVSDRRNWGVADRWETPQEMFARGGDCEGYALTKYFALGALGVASADMRIAVVWDRRDREEHAVLLVRDGDATWVLDNKTETPTRLSADPDRYRLIYAIGPDGARLAGSAATGSGRPRLVDGGRTLVLNVTPRHRAGPRPSQAAQVLPAGQ